MPQFKFNNRVKIDHWLIIGFVLAVGTLALQSSWNMEFAPHPAKSTTQLAHAAELGDHLHEGAPKIAVDQPVYNFGEVASGAVISHNFAIRNEGAADLVISRVQASCGCTATHLSRAMIPPGEEATVEVKLDLTKRIGRQDRSLIVISNDPISPHCQLSMTGHVDDQNR